MAHRGEPGTGRYVSFRNEYNATAEPYEKYRVDSTYIEESFCEERPDPSSWSDPDIDTEPYRENECRT